MNLSSTLISEEKALLATFHVADSVFALDAAGVHEVLRLTTITPVPHAPPQVPGVINLRGRIVTVLDAGMILGSIPARRSRESCIFLIEDHGEILGLLVDGAGEVIETQQGQLEALPANIPPDQARFFRGVFRSSGRVITVIQQAEVLSAGQA